MQKIINFFPLYRVSFDDTPLPPPHTNESTIPKDYD